MKASLPHLYSTPAPPTILPVLTVLLVPGLGRAWCRQNTLPGLEATNKEEEAVRRQEGLVLVWLFPTLAELHGPARRCSRMAGAAGRSPDMLPALPRLPAVGRTQAVPCPVNSGGDSGRHHLCPSCPARSPHTDTARPGAAQEHRGGAPWGQDGSQATVLGRAFSRSRGWKAVRGAKEAGRAGDSPSVPLLPAGPGQQRSRPARPRPAWSRGDLPRNRPPRR